MLIVGQLTKYQSGSDSSINQSVGITHDLYNILWIDNSTVLSIMDSIDKEVDIGNDSKLAPESVWARCSSQLFEAYVTFVSQHGNAEGMSSAEIQAMVIQQHEGRNAFPEPMMSYYPYMFAAAPEILLPPLIPNELDNSSVSISTPFENDLVFRIEEIIGNDDDHDTDDEKPPKNRPGSGSQSDTSSSSSSESSTIPAKVHENNCNENQMEQECSKKDGSPSFASSPTNRPSSVADNVNIKADTLNGFANFITDYSAKHGLTPEEAMTQMMHATELFEINEHLTRDNIGAISLNTLHSESESENTLHSEVINELKYEQLNGTEQADNHKTENDISSDKDSITPELLCASDSSSVSVKSESATQTDVITKETESEPELIDTSACESVDALRTEPNFPKVWPSTSTTSYTFHSSQLENGNRTGNFYTSHEQQMQMHSSNAMRMPHSPQTPPMYWSPPYFDQFNHFPPPLRFGPVSAPPAVPGCGYPHPMPQQSLMIPPDLPLGLGAGGAFGPPMPMYPPFMPPGLLIETNKKGICPFCRKNGEDESIYKSHNLYQPGTRKVICPVLRRFKCEICGASGDFAHTKGYCKYNDGNGNHISAPPPPPSSPPPPPEAFQ